jgi:hypothetical protein
MHNTKNQKFLYYQDALKRGQKSKIDINDISHVCCEFNIFRTGLDADRRTQVDNYFWKLVYHYNLVEKCKKRDDTPFSAKTTKSNQGDTTIVYNLSTFPEDLRYILYVYMEDCMCGPWSSSGD